MSLYREASVILTATNGSLKSRIYNVAPGTFKTPPKRLYALVIETLKHQEILSEVLLRSSILALEKLSHPLALLLLHDLLLSKSGIAVSNGPMKAAILRHKARLSAEFTKARLRLGHSTTAAYVASINALSIANALPRWARVNTLLTTVGDVLAHSEFTSYRCVNTLPELLAAPDGKVVYRDEFIPALLAFPPATDLTTTALYTTGHLILQDRSSCLPAHLLAPPPGATVIDGTAAPGNKTTHLASLVHSKYGRDGGKVIAFEKNVRRAEILKKMVARVGGSGMIEVHAGDDFLKTDPGTQEWRGVTHLLLDPSCSGSGIVTREDYVLAPLTSLESVDGCGKGGRRKKTGNPAAGSKPGAKKFDREAAAAEEEERKKTTRERLAALANFQRAIVQHAMAFSDARKITYSTCSVHREENEDVVMAVLRSRVALDRGWRVERREEGTLHGWARRGVVEFCMEGQGEVERERAQMIAEACVRCEPVIDGGIGFFVCAFVRDGEKEQWDGTSGGAGLGRASVGKKGKRLQMVQEVDYHKEDEEEWGGCSG